MLHFLIQLPDLLAQHNFLYMLFTHPGSTFTVYISCIVFVKVFFNFPYRR